jgi:serine/threonine protein kinase
MTSSAVSRLGEREVRTPETTLAISQLANGEDLALEHLAIDTLREMATAWKSGGRAPAEQWLDRNPQIAAQPDAAVRIIYEEICLREELGEPIESQEFYRRFPQWQAALKVLLDCHRLMEPERGVRSFPTAGERLGEFQLLSEIDRGAVGRVFLATQPGLSDRLLVVKLTPRSGDEHLSLARLQHTHIAPLYLVQDFAAENLRALCMPYVGGLNWARLLQSLHATRPARRTGRQLVELLETAPQDLPVAVSFSGPALHYLNRASYVQAVCWVAACLADALHYAHQRGLVHLDIKPSNVLLAGDGQPMLLDFHLAREVIPPNSGPVDRLGGTRGYMSPEQERAALAVREGAPISMGLDGRSDIFSLGILLFESLVGKLPPPNELASRRALREANPEVSRGLEDLVHKCLMYDPADRYQDAGELAGDLRRHLADLPLRGVGNRSLKERWDKWRRRKPQALLLAGTALAALAIVAALGLSFAGERIRAGHAALLHGQEKMEDREFTAAIEQLTHGRDAIGWLPWQHELRSNLQSQLQLAKRARLADALHTLVRQLHYVDGYEFVPPEKLRELQAGCRTVWQARTQILGPNSAASTQLEQRMRTDLLDLALLAADLDVRLAPRGKVDAVRRQALQMLDEAQSLCGSSPVLDFVRREYRLALGESAESQNASSPRPKTAWEHYAVGRFLLRASKLDQAQSEFQQAIDLEPGEFWPNFYQTVCAYRMRDYERSLNAAFVCVALSPASAECFYNRALSQQALGHAELALADLGRALKLEPDLAIAALHRGMLLAELKRYDEANRDLQSALVRGADPAEVHYQFALIHLAQQDRAAARKDLVQALEHEPEHSGAHALMAKLDSGR